MGKLLSIIDTYKDTHGQPSDASVARAVGIAPQTLSSWRKRGIRQPPEPDTLRRLAAFMNVPHLDVVHAALYDAGWITQDDLDRLDRGTPASSGEGEVRGA